MVVWGGQIQGSGLDTGGRYDPAKDSWSATSLAGAPYYRYAHTAVWTGRLMLVWGGFNGSSMLANGHRYDPEEDSWTPISSVNEPSYRMSHTAIWTGGRMVVWGGGVWDEPIYYSTGGRYDPVTDRWAPTSIVDAPSGRVGHTAVWTGSSMIVWGGYGSLDLRSGGRYALAQSVHDRSRPRLRR